MKSLTQFLLESNNSKYSSLGKLEIFSYKNPRNVISFLYNSDLYENIKKEYNEKDYDHPASGFWAKISGKGESGNNYPNGYRVTNYGNTDNKYIQRKDWPLVGMLLQYILDNVDNLEKVKKELSNNININLEEKGKLSTLTIDNKGDFLKFKFKK